MVFCFRLLYLCWQNPGNRAPNGAELLKAANLLFSSLEPRYLWQYVGVLFSEACHKIPSTSLTYLSSSRNDNGDDSDVKPVDSGDPSLVEVCYFLFYFTLLSLHNASVGRNFYKTDIISQFLGYN